MTTERESTEFRRLAARCGATEDGQKWLTMAVDPFHDVDVSMIGFPDGTGQRSLIFNVTKQVEVAAPAGVTGAFDAHVAFMPSVRFGTYGYGSKATIDPDPSYGTPGMFNATAPGATVSATGGMPDGIVVASTVATGDQTFNNTAAIEEFARLSITDTLSPGEDQLMRVVGIALEVENVTEELHKSGTVVYYRYPQSPDDLALQVNWASGDNVATNVPFTLQRGPPNTAADAKQLNGITARAEEGALIPGVLDLSHMKPQKPRSGLHGIISNGKLILPEQFENCVLGLDQSAGTMIAPSEGTPSFIPIAMMGAGAYFTNLANESKLTVLVRAIVEVFPQPGNPLVPLAHATPGLDERVQQCYGEIMRSMHAGYPVDHNSAGEFFRKALNTLRVVSHSIQPALTAAAAVDRRVAPIAALNSAAAGVMDQASGSLQHKKQKKKKKLKQA